MDIAQNKGPDTPGETSLKTWNERPAGGRKVNLKVKGPSQPLDNLKPFLVGGIATPLKNMKVNWDDYFQYMEKKKKMFQTTN